VYISLALNGSLVIQHLKMGLINPLEICRGIIFAFYSNPLDLKPLFTRRIRKLWLNKNKKLRIRNRPFIPEAAMDVSNFTHCKHP